MKTSVTESEKARSDSDSSSGDDEAEMRKESNKAEELKLGSLISHVLQSSNPVITGRAYEYVKEENDDMAKELHDAALKDE